MEAAAEGIGATRLLYYLVIEAVRAGSLMVLLEQFELTPPCPLLHAALGQRPLKMRRFLDFSAPRLREALAQLDTPRSVTPIPGIGSRSLSAPLLMTGFEQDSAIRLGSNSYYFPAKHVSGIVRPDESGSGQYYVRLIPPGSYFWLVHAPWKERRANNQGPGVPTIADFYDHPADFAVMRCEVGPIVC
jgi:hypothetical protein